VEPWRTAGLLLSCFHDFITSHNGPFPRSGFLYKISYEAETLDLTVEQLGCSSRHADEVGGSVSLRTNTQIKHLQCSALPGESSARCLHLFFQPSAISAATINLGLPMRAEWQSRSLFSRPPVYVFLLTVLSPLRSPISSEVTPKRIQTLFPVYD
jgi:hypothetical protein